MIREVVGVSVDVDEAGRHDQIACVDRCVAPCEACDGADRGNAAILDRDVRADGRPPGAVDHAAADDDGS